MIVCLLRGAVGNSYYDFIQSGKTRVQILLNTNNLKNNQYQKIINLAFPGMINFVVNYKNYPIVSICLLKDVEEVRIRKNTNTFFLYPRIYSEKK